MLAGLIAPRLGLGLVSASISCEHYRSSRNNPHYAPRHIIYYLSCYLLESYKNVYRKSNAKCECHDESVFLKADRALSKLNFFFNFKSKTNLITLKKCDSHLQYYKIDLSYSIKLQEINLNVCEEYKTKREAGRYVNVYYKI